MKAAIVIMCLAVVSIAGSCANPEGNESFRESMRDGREKLPDRDRSDEGNTTSDDSDTLEMNQ